LVLELVLVLVLGLVLGLDRLISAWAKIMEITLLY
jgi:hypothetical protein